MTDQTADLLPLQDFFSVCACRCSQKDGSASGCVGVRPLNKEWTFHLAYNPFFSNPVAVLRSSTPNLPTYTFEWSDDDDGYGGMLGTFSSTGRTISNPFTTATDRMTLDFMHHELLEKPDAFIPSSLERAALSDVVADLRMLERVRARMKSRSFMNLPL
ncbi:hypothetical protein RBB50_012048 [Rhinocladiella similis]